ncbi:hypothetical protein [Dictyobacter arantiisoli]|uniref:Uncharacterized protein n=1 Tax=Dictyobacter arantiisoli TaxID=2014874 RepID=A0A5A5TJ70_9CHLR|nr:hypothetical protein [Dictyobacter arantiisoli]GCF11268.1 hypothetical protein KDI_48320 [Dictyobacter arantiisoli]
MPEMQQEATTPPAPPIIDFPRGAPVALKQVNFYEYSIWGDGTVIIEHVLEAGFTRLSSEEARALRNFLNNGDVRAALGVPIDCPPYRSTQHTPLQGEKENTHA